MHTCHPREGREGEDRIGEERRGERSHHRLEGAIGRSDDGVVCSATKDFRGHRAAFNKFR